MAVDLMGKKIEGACETEGKGRKGREEEEGRIPWANLYTKGQCEGYLYKAAVVAGHMDGGRNNRGGFLR